MKIPQVGNIACWWCKAEYEIIEIVCCGVVRIITTKNKLIGVRQFACDCAGKCAIWLCVLVEGYILLLRFETDLRIRIKSMFSRDAVQITHCRR